jgi:pimeloyl-ACP methyl ester carboxylesterase
MTKPRNQSTSDSSASPIDLLPAVKGDHFTLDVGSARVNVYVAGEGEPLLLLHSINAAASAYEVKPIFDTLQQDHTVYALDLPGFGTSSRGDIDYSVTLYVETILAAVRLISRRHDGMPVDVLALSLTSEFLARAALRHPASFRSLMMITPTGFEKGARNRRGPAGSTREIAALKGTMAIGPIRNALFGLLVSRPSVSFFLKRTFATSKVDPELVDYAYRSAHQPGAAHAPAAFISGRLFSNDIRDVYEELSLPVWLAYGTKGAFSDFSESEWVRTCANWVEDSFETGAFPHYQDRPAFLAAMRRFLASVPTPAEIAERGMRAPQSAMTARQAG